MKWPASDRVNLPTASGKRTVRVYLEPGRGSLRPPLEGKPTALVFRNGEFELVDAPSSRAANPRRSCPGTAIERGRGHVTRILLVRHGQSTWNAEGRWQGRADPPLSDLGRRQAEVAAGTVAGHGITRVCSSPLRRAHETATIVAATLGLAVHPDDRLMERDAGAWQGRTRTEIEAGWPGYLADGRRPEGFETDDVLHERALAAIHEIAAGADEPIIVVSHGGLIRVVERALGSEPHSVPNLGGLELRRSPDGVELVRRTVLIDPAAVTVTAPPEV